jgi:hypothetical protein
MHIKKCDFDYSRRLFMEKTAKGLSSGMKAEYNGPADACEYLTLQAIRRLGA